jgi:hypothetical protein
MLKWLRKLWSSISGRAESPAAPPPAPVPDPPARPAPPPSPAPQPEPEPGALTYELQRYSAGPFDTLGRLVCKGETRCVTLEGPLAAREGWTAAVPPGAYALALRTDGGLHATYAYRYKDQHKGLLWLQDAPGLVTVQTGNQSRYAYGSILLGVQPVREQDLEAPREIWHSEQSYRFVYQEIASELAAGRPVRLVIRNPEA